MSGARQLMRRVAHLAALLRRPTRTRSVLFFVLGVGLLVGALWVIAGQGEALSGAMAAARRAPFSLSAAVILLPIVNWLATTGCFWVVTNRYGRVSATEMAGLIGAAWLLNILPMRPGLFGRIAYHRAVNGIAFRDSVRVQVATLASTAVALVVLLPMVLLAAGRGDTTVGLAAAAPALVLAGAAVSMRVLLAGSDLARHWWRLVAAVAFRYVDMLAWVVRYFLVFLLIDRPIHLDAAGAVTAASQVATLAPVQFGLREWIVGLTCRLLPGSFLASGAQDAGPGSELGAGLAPGLMADLVNRAAELAVFVPVGVVCTLIVWRTMARSARSIGSPLDR